MDIREAVKDKENYGSIVTYFRALEQPDMAQMCLLIDTIEKMSPEIYEHYRALQDIFRSKLRSMLDCRDAEGSRELTKDFAYLLAKGCSTGTLLEEKYKAYLNND